MSMKSFSKFKNESSLYNRQGEKKTQKEGKKIKLRNRISDLNHKTDRQTVVA